MNVTLSIDDSLVKEVRKIAIDQDTTLTGLVRDYLENLVAESNASGRKRRQQDALKRSFQRLRFPVGEKSWKRSDLYDRS
ncbi:MAG TPA: DUF6364 family protein [Candidatus Acidoferrum sp.]|jgi:hypothetical protein